MVHSNRIKWNKPVEFNFLLKRILEEYLLQGGKKSPGGFFIIVNGPWFVDNHLITGTVPGVDVWRWNWDCSLFPSGTYIPKWQSLLLPQRPDEDGGAELGAGGWGLARWVQGALLRPRGSPHRSRVRRRKPYPAAGTSKEAKMQKLQVVLGECFSRLEGSHCEGKWCGKFKQQLQIWLCENTR